MPTNPIARATTLTWAAAWLVLVATATACTGGGDHGTTTPSTSPATVTPAMAAKCRHLVRAWNPSGDGYAARPAFGAHLRMRVGETHRFRVVTKPDFYTGWTPPVSNNPHRVGLTDVRDPLRNGVSYNCLISGTIVARAPGHAVVSSGTDLPCFHAHPACLPPAFGWLVRVTVIPG